jgi:NAD+ kinase
VTVRPCPVPKRVGIIHKRSSPEAEARAGQLAKALAARKIAVLTEDGAVRDQSDLVVVLGGDGTLIHAAGLLSKRKEPVPILGVNMGSLGFLTEIPLAELEETLEAVLAGKARVSERLKLKVSLERKGKGGEAVDAEVLNDVVINKGALARMADLEATCAGEYVTTYRADGVIVATPTGSTAYALAANGPILHPQMEGIIVAPICPHTLTQRPIVVPDDREITLELKSQNGNVYLTLDGQTGVPLQAGDRVHITPSPNRAQLVCNLKMDYFGILRAKLRWGER